VKPNINSVGFIHKLSNIGPPVDGALVSAASLWPPNQTSGQCGFSVYKTRPSFLHGCALFRFDELFRVFGGSIIMELETKAICRRCFVVFKILVVLAGLVMRASEPWKSIPLV
jgi:hypothetical protein